MNNQTAQHRKSLVNFPHRNAHQIDKPYIPVAFQLGKQITRQDKRQTNCLFYIETENTVNNSIPSRHHLLIPHGVDSFQPPAKHISRQQATQKSFLEERAR